MDSELVRKLKVNQSQSGSVWPQATRRIFRVAQHWSVQNGGKGEGQTVEGNNTKWRDKQRREKNMVRREIKWQSHVITKSNCARHQTHMPAGIKCARSCTWSSCGDMVAPRILSRTSTTIIFVFVPRRRIIMA